MGNAEALNPKGFSVLLRIQHWYKPCNSELGKAECSISPFNISVGKKGNNILHNSSRKMQV